MKYLITSLFFVFLIVSCGGGEEIDPDNSFIENYKNVNWRANDGFAYVWVTENYFFYYDALSNICSKFPLNGTANFGINGFYDEEYSLQITTIANTGSSLALKLIVTDTDINETWNDHFYLVVTGNSLSFEFCDGIDAIPGAGGTYCEKELYSKSEDNLFCN